MKKTKTENGTGSLCYTERYKFDTVQELSQLSAVIIGHTEYPLDGGTPKEVDVDSHLYPFLLPRCESPSEELAYTVPVRAICEGIGATCVWDNAAQTATCTYLDTTLVLTLNSNRYLKDGSAQTAGVPVTIQDGVLTCGPDVFTENWLLMLDLADDAERHAVNWLAIP